jgi:sugar transferase (PEP-CTERM/EpsH1 system associated)
VSVSTGATSTELADPLRILWLKTELLHPVDRGGRIRTYQMLRQLRRAHQVTYLALDDGGSPPEAVARAEEYCQELVRVPHRLPVRGSMAFNVGALANLLSPLPYTVTRFRAPEMTRRIHELVRGGRVDVLVCDFLFPSVNVPRDLECATVLFQHNVEAEIWRRHVEAAGNPAARAYFASQWRRVRAFEGAQCARYDHVAAVSEADRALMRRQYGIESVSAIPTGVDVEYVRPGGGGGGGGGGAREPANLVFTGAMDWMPNEDAMLRFVADTLPRIRRSRPDVTLTVVGRNPPARLRALAGATPGVTVTGGVPDVRPYLERASVFVVPIRIGGGTRLKIFEAMAMEKPVVSTTIGAEGLPVRDGVDALLADDPDAFAAAVLELLADPARAERMGKTAAARVRSEFGWDRVAEQFSDICARAARARRFTSEMEPA